MAATAVNHRNMAANAVYHNITDHIADFSGTRFGHSIRERVRERRTLIQCLGGSILYVLLGALIYSLWMDITFIDGMYLAVVTFTTVGYGDVDISTNGQKVFTIIFILIGICVTLSIFLTVLTDGFFNMMETLSTNRKSKLEEEVVKNVSARSMKMDDGNDKEAGKRKESSMLNDVCFTVVMSSSWFIVLLLPAICIGVIEGWNVLDILYFTVVTATTVGYGDFSPSNQWMRLFSVIYIPICMVVMTRVVGKVSGVYFKRKVEMSEREYMKSRRLSMADLHHMDHQHGDGDGVVSYDEFLIFMLLAMGKVGNREVKVLKELYDKLDSNKDGKLTSNDLFHLTYGESAYGGLARALNFDEDKDDDNNNDDNNDNDNKDENKEDAGKETTTSNNDYGNDEEKGRVKIDHLKIFPFYSGNSLSS